MRNIYHKKTLTFNHKKLRDFPESTPKKPANCCTHQRLLIHRSRRILVKTCCLDFKNIHGRIMSANLLFVFVTTNFLILLFNVEAESRKNIHKSF